ncbi:uncharacterized protein LOC143630989 [Bidens hawaiensis]|uniref:uncharacterized protein LOC143630989 n=1 Tax=Bidens hawaiensis TaxID=980011 RepID=UPI00404A2C24
MVITWILNTLTRDISDSVLYAETAQSLWNELNSRFGQANGAMFYLLQKNLCQITRGSKDISTYFAKMKSNWDELNAINTITSCTCGAAYFFAKREEDQRSNILMMQPLPYVNRAYGILMQDEKQKEIHTITDFTTSSTSMNASSGGLTSGETGETRRALVCTHCKRNGHSVNKCYKLIGFPKDFKFTKGKKFANLAEDQGNSGQNQSEQHQGITQQQYNDLVVLLKQTKV